MSSVRQTFQPFVIRGGSPASAPEDAVKPDGEVKGPLVLAFLDRKDGYSESELEAAPIGQLETFLLKLGGDFTFVGRLRRLRIGDDWYRGSLLGRNRQAYSVTNGSLEEAEKKFLLADLDTSRSLPYVGRSCQFLFVRSSASTYNSDPSLRFIRQWPLFPEGKGVSSVGASCM